MKYLENEWNKLVECELYLPFMVKSKISLYSSTDRNDKI